MGAVGTAGQGKAGLGSRAGKSEGSLPNVKLRWGLGSGMAKMCREGGKEEESSKGNPQARAQCRVEGAFHYQTREDIPVEQKMWQELGLFYIVSAQPAPFPVCRDTRPGTGTLLIQPFPIPA